MTYINEISNDVRAYINENIDLSLYDDSTEAYMALYDELYDTLWAEDSVTGNASGSYTFSREKAKENIFSRMDEVLWALYEFNVEKEEVGKHFLAMDWEWFDVTARCALLGTAISNVLDEIWKEA